MAIVTESTPVSPNRPISERGHRDHDIPNSSIVTPAEDMRTMMLHSVSWGAVFAGAAFALVSQVILNMIGLGIGLSTVDPAGNGTPTAGSLSTGAGIWFVVSGILASAAGGYLAHLIHRAVASGAFRVAGARDRASVSTRVEQDCLVGV